MAQEEFLDRQMPDVIEQWRHYLSVLSIDDRQRVLDVGCGYGDTERLLIRYYPSVGRVVGIDHSAERIASAHDAEFAVADVRDLPFPNGSFDRAICVDVLEWVDDPLKAIREIRRVLKPDGIAVIVHSDFDAQVYNNSDKDLGREVVHAFSDSGPNGQLGRQLYSLCNKAGFESVEPSIYTLVNTEWYENLYGCRMADMIVE